jgi:PAS domain S-box-containing protein
MLVEVDHRLRPLHAQSRRHRHQLESGAERFKGYTRDQIMGQHFSRFYTEEDRARGLPARALQTAAREGKFESEGWRVRKDGTVSGPMS